MCCSKIFFVPRSQPPMSDPEICNPLWTLEQELSEKITFSTTNWIFFLTFLFFVPSLKRRLILLFVSVFSLYIICLFQCSAVITLVRFLVISVFVSPQIRHSGFGRLYQSSDALVGGIVGIRLTPSVVIIFFWQLFFFL